jgi:YD repeat-containing protein
MTIDRMSGQVIGADGSWNPFFNPGDPGFTVYDSPEKPAMWRLDYLNEPVPNPRAQLFNIDLSIGLFIQRKMDFIFDDDDYPLEFTRVYTINDAHSRAFGVGTTHTLDLFLVGQMGSYVDLCVEDGGRIHFIHQPPRPGEDDSYRQVGGWSGPFAGSAAKFDGSEWRVKRNDGWTLYFPYHPDWPPQYTTVLGSFSDPAGREYKMERGNAGDLLSVTTPSGKWLHFDYDGQHRIRRIESSFGRTMRYEYDRGGRLIRTVDSDGYTDVYTYDEKSQMLTAAHKDGVPVVANAYSNDSYIESETVADSGKFQFSYSRGPRNVIYESQITDPHDMLTSFLFQRDGYTQTLPRLAGH